MSGFFIYKPTGLVRCKQEDITIQLEKTLDELTREENFCFEWTFRDKIEIACYHTEYKGRGMIFTFQRDLEVDIVHVENMILCCKFLQEFEYQP